ncbi:DUF302 domain-containing protein [Thiosulfatihalobacter marinus]|uniref:DUF302 domain-containing protein n=1 Tax=Thiosulfatihalobacter marinus TaxID=2792481 RepID=UPI0018D725BF
MAYTYNRILRDLDIDEAETRIRNALADNGFGVLTEIDVAATMKAKLGVDIAPYRILGACNPTMVHEAIGLESRIGTMLPCNVILRQVEEGVEIGVIDPVASMQAVENKDLHPIADLGRELLENAVNAA